MEIGKVYSGNCVVIESLNAPELLVIPRYFCQVDERGRVPLLISNTGEKRMKVNPSQVRLQFEVTGHNSQLNLGYAGMTEGCHK